jgi:hypothetical protein
MPDASAARAAFISKEAAPRSFVLDAAMTCPPQI